MVTKPMRLAPGVLHIVTEKDYFLGPEVVGQVNSLESRIRTLIYVAGIVRKSVLSPAFDVFKPVFLRGFDILGDPAALKRYLRVPIPPGKIAGIEDIGPRSELVVVVDGNNSGLSPDILNIFLSQRGATSKDYERFGGRPRFFLAGMLALVMAFFTGAGFLTILFSITGVSILASIRSAAFASSTK